MGQVYPRVYGGTSISSARCHHWTGLSPRVRGNQTDSELIDQEQRSIPACTGEPPLLYASDDLSQVYPRVYGGTHVLLSLVTRVQ